MVTKKIEERNRFCFTCTYTTLHRDDNVLFVSTCLKCGIDKRIKTKEEIEKLAAEQREVPEFEFD